MLPIVVDNAKNHVNEYLTVVKKIIYQVWNRLPSRDSQRVVGEGRRPTVGIVRAGGGPAEHGGAALRARPGARFTRRIPHATPPQRAPRG